MTEIRITDNSPIIDLATGGDFADRAAAWLQDAHETLRGAAPAMTRDLHLPRGTMAKFERLNDPDAWPVVRAGIPGKQNEEEEA